MLIERGDIFYADLDPTRGSEQSGRRPVLVIQNDIGNRYSPTTIVAPLTSKAYSREFPANVHIPKSVGGLTADSIILLTQIRTIDKERLARKIGHLPPEYLQKVNSAIKVSLGLI